MSTMNSQTNFIEEQTYAIKNREVNNDNIYIDYELYDCEPNESDINELFDESDYEGYLEEQRQFELYASIEYIGNLQSMLSDNIHAEKILKTKADAVIEVIGGYQYKHILDIILHFISALQQRLEDAWKQYESLNP
jgi:hypothetical protein